MESKAPQAVAVLGARAVRIEHEEKNLHLPCIPLEVFQDCLAFWEVLQMELLYQCCCGLDIHKKMLVACLINPTPDGKRHKEVRTFRTVTSDLLELLDWLKAAGCTHVAMEATGVYWKPIYNILEGHVELLVVNAQHIKAVPGRKTDVKDAEWIADLLQHGLLKSSFIPSTEQRELRDLTRYRTTLIEERVRAVNRLHKQLEDTNLKLGDVVSDITGKSAQAILKALLAGESDPHKLADLARGGSKPSERIWKRHCREPSPRITASCSPRFWGIWISWRKRLNEWGSRSKLAWVPGCHLTVQVTNQRRGSRRAG